MTTRLLSLLLTGFITLFSSSISATNFSIHNTVLYEEGEELFADIALSWENAWRNAKNHDAIWLFAKLGRPDGGFVHLPIAASGHTTTVLEGPELSFDVPSDQTGAFIFPANQYRGNIRATIRLQLDKGALENIWVRNFDFKAYGIEMVYIPEGGFQLGDPDKKAREFSGVYAWSENDNANGLFTVKSEDQVIEIGEEEGKLTYSPGRNNYGGDGSGTIPAAFPKGVQGFYIMKYELTQGQYADFLNSLTSTMSSYHCMFGIKDYYKNRGTIYAKNGVYHAKDPSRPLNYSSWDDGMAYADWAGLRPMTELEFVKACRGDRTPIAHGFPWGTNSRQQIQRVVNSEGQLILMNGWDESQLNDKTLPVFGASHYWVMDLAGSIWERVITIGDEKGRAFTGQHGDGELSYYGFADVEDWPTGQLETEGFGFRGGGFYTHDRPYNEFNPYSPIAYRRYGGWPGGVRTEAYGQRFVRTKE